MSDQITRVVIREPFTKVTIKPGSGINTLIREPVTVVRIIPEHTRRVSEGKQGIAGPPGTNGVAADFEQSFLVAALQHVVNHNLGRRPIPAITSPGGAELETLVLHQNQNQFIVYCVEPTAVIVRCI